MMTLSMQQGALITRDAYQALVALRGLVDRATEKIRQAEREAVGLAIGRSEETHPVEALRIASETLQSPTFEAAVAEARTKTETAMAWHLREHS
jgi:hypothetical protein